MLQCKYEARGHTITSKHIAEQLRYDDHSAANFQYGKQASKIGEIFEIEETQIEK